MAAMPGGIRWTFRCAAVSRCTALTGALPLTGTSPLTWDSLEKIREHGYAPGYKEREPGASAVSAPIFDRTGKLAAALSVSGPVSRLTLQRLEEYGPVLVEAAREMGMMM